MKELVIQHVTLRPSVERGVRSHADYMNSIKELVSPYKGSEATYEAVREQLRERYGDECADEFDPYSDAMPYSSWLIYGFRVKKGEKALKSVTFVEVRDQDDKVMKKIRRVVNLFHRRQVEKVA